MSATKEVQKSYVRRFSMHLSAASHLFHNYVLISPRLRSEMLGQPSY